MGMPTQVVSNPPKLLPHLDELKFKSEKHNEEVVRIESARLPTVHGLFHITAYREPSGKEHLVVRMGDIHHTPPVVRLHSECLTGDVFGSVRCDCREQLDESLAYLAAEGRGLLVYLRQEGRGIGLANKVRAYALQDRGLDTVEANHHLGFPADMRSYAIAAAMLKDQGVHAIRLVTNNPQKVADLEACNISIVERIPPRVLERAENRRYFQTKVAKLGHLG
jgi:3,4-dihydroxy 2-butanone 4-phosphate synthase/GTP cyclohydrolase II